MVQIPSPPPQFPPTPVFYNLKSGAILYRIFDPTRFGTTPLTFRTNGPRARFDHHRNPANAPKADPDRGIWYGAEQLSGAIVEVFGDSKIIDPTNKFAALVTTSKRLRLLDLRNSGAMQAGTVAALSKTTDYRQSQEWSLHFYETDIYQNVDGLIYFNAHNDEIAFALYERCQSHLASNPADIIALNHPALRDGLIEIAHCNGMIVYP